MALQKLKSDGDLILILNILVFWYTTNEPWYLLPLSSRKDRDMGGILMFLKGNKMFLPKIK